MLKSLEKKMDHQTRMVLINATLIELDKIKNTKRKYATEKMAARVAKVWAKCDIFEPKKWLELNKEKLRTGRHKEVFEEIANKYASLENKEKDNGLTKCYRYMEKRLGYMNYQKALASGLPIGSGGIESSHGHVIQKRLKIAGAWWKAENANAMLNLRIGRLNGYWEAYWNSQRRVA